jgi:DnaK suppressor protein
VDKKSIKQFEKALLAKRAELQNAYRDKLSRSGDAGADGALDPADEASVNYNKEFWYALSDADRKIMRLIDEALRSIQNKTFGECSHCGKPIQRKRLEAVPWARHCLECQDLQDRGLIE